MKITHLIYIIPLSILVGIFLGVVGEDQLMVEYDLYQCIYDNAEDNGFSQNPYLIGKIQDECVCFRNHNYNATDIFEVNCSNYNAKIQ